jgi:hypothetical protein
MDQKYLRKKFKVLKKLDIEGFDWLLHITEYFRCLDIYNTILDLDKRQTFNELSPEDQKTLYENVHWIAGAYARQQRKVPRSRKLLNTLKMPILRAISAWNTWWIERTAKGVRYRPRDPSIMV